MSGDGHGCSCRLTGLIVPASPAIDFKPDGTDSYIDGLESGVLTNWNFHGARVQLDFKGKGSSAVAEISFVMGKYGPPASCRGQAKTAGGTHSLE